jgi:glycosyltransferase involved in cell wall biosynthesis
MVGQLSHQEALKILATLGAIILPSRWEGLPILVLEAMGIGVPVISMKVSGLDEIIRNGINGILVERRSGEDLAKQVEMVTKDEVLRASIIETAKKTVQGQFSMEKMLASILNIYKEHSISHLNPLRGK